MGLLLRPGKSVLTREPMFEGHPLSFWLKECDKDFDGITKKVGPGPGRNAVRQIGTNALPWLLRMARNNSFDLRWEAEKFLGGHVHIRDRAQERAHDRAWMGFAALGSLAEPAAPTLIGMLDDRRWKIRRSAATSLGYIGPAARQAVPALSFRKQDPNSEVRSCAVWALERIQAQPGEMDAKPNL